MSGSFLVPLFKKENALLSSLFKVRNDIHWKQPTSQAVSSLVEDLVCPICMRLLINPVFVKCSHRFCRECLQKVINWTQGNTAKCPQCMVPFKRDEELRIDLFTTEVLKEIAHSIGVKGVEGLNDYYERLEMEEI